MVEIRQNCVGGVMVSVFVSSAVDRGFETGWLGIRIMCPNGATCLSLDCCYSALAL
jgi:hypothetical protein